LIKQIWQLHQLIGHSILMVQSYSLITNILQPFKQRPWELAAFCKVVQHQWTHLVNVSTHHYLTDTMGKRQQALWFQQLTSFVYDQAIELLWTHSHISWVDSCWNLNLIGLANLIMNFSQQIKVNSFGFILSFFLIFVNLTGSQEFLEHLNVKRLRRWQLFQNLSHARNSNALCMQTKTIINIISCWICSCWNQNWFPTFVQHQHNVN
jgi:hypothetical protein